MDFNSTSFERQMDIQITFFAYSDPVNTRRWTSIQRFLNVVNVGWTSKQRYVLTAILLTQDVILNDMDVETTL